MFFLKDIFLSLFSQIFTSFCIYNNFYVISTSKETLCSLRSNAILFGFIFDRHFISLRFPATNFFLSHINRHFVVFSVFFSHFMNNKALLSVFPTPFTRTLLFFLFGHQNFISSPPLFIAYFPYLNSLLPLLSFYQDFGNYFISLLLFCYQF